MSKPDFVLKALDKVTGDRCTVGAGWATRDAAGSIRRVSIKLNPCVQLVPSETIVLSLFPQDRNDQNTVEGDFDDAPF